MAELTLADKTSQVQEAIRQKPSDDKLRVHLFQLYAQAGKWQKALGQLQVAAQLNETHKLLAQAYRLALRAEMVRADVFAGTRTPQVLGKPAQWLGFLIEALQMDAKGQTEQAAELRIQALDAAEAVSGRINESHFDWIADADSRLGPVLEVFVNGDYYWLPFESVVEVKIDKPEDLRDLVWLPAHVKLVNEGLHPMMLPARYPLVEGVVEDGHLRSRLTSWSETSVGDFIGHGVKVFSTNAREMSLLDIREIRLDSKAE
ncbi:type VI secretion system accessory protein TagJ [Diaphorobacter caeni]|uniref:type VI secretion system accessory protein TagJ n=1 Tax=Diaphorobacter caeni TaxID=2784387 RepID=UPI00188F324B|nr:type VI secretion system accessory protein TagJ [Diaphorobacter caeni]MBF5004451.1 virulence protein SciE type [Diaphorobacter caeni]